MKSRKKIIFLSIPIIILIILFLIIKTLFFCNVSDNEAIELAKAFCNKMGVKYSHEPWISDSMYETLILNSKVKIVEFGQKGDSIISIFVNCRNKEVVYFSNRKITESVYDKYNISSIITNEPRKFPPFLSESKAKEIIFSIAEKINLPSDAEFSKLSIDKNFGYWIGHWKRKYKGFFYDEDFNSITITIMAIDGEFYNYRKRFFGQPCPTNVKITREEAKKESWRQLNRIFSSKSWNEDKDIYEIKSDDLKIVQPNAFFGRFSPLYSTKSRLAWVVVYGFKKEPEEPTMLPERITVNIDAETKKFLGGGYPP